jgi:hypothetical protein
VGQQIGGGGGGMPLQVFWDREGLGPLACSYPELINPEILILWTVGRTLWAGEYICGMVAYLQSTT